MPDKEPPAPASIRLVPYSTVILETLLEREAAALVANKDGTYHA